MTASHLVPRSLNTAVFTCHGSHQLLNELSHLEAVLNSEKKSSPNEEDRNLITVKVRANLFLADAF